MPAKIDRSLSRSARVAAGIAAIVVSLSPASFAAAQSDLSWPLFADDSTLRLRIAAPFGEIRDSKRERREFDGLFRYVDAAGAAADLDVKLRVRGRFRLEYCSFPPLRLNFRQRQVAGTEFAGQDKLKLVTLCNRPGYYRDYLAQEYQIYRAYNALTEKSLRVRWASVEYDDTMARRRSSFTAPAFLIEADWEAADRIGAEPIRVEANTVEQLHPRATTLLSVFQFMIGNTDWSALSPASDDDCCHNVFVMQDGSGRRIAVPYDFDNAGIISTEYAQPSERLRLRSVRQRLYRGFCSMNEHLEWAIQRINERRAAVEGAFNAAPASEGTRQDSLAYLRTSYEIINDPERRQEQIVERCRS